MEKELVIYQTPEGRAPFEIWLLGLKDKQGRAKIRARINRLQLGNFGDCKSVGEGVSELRINFGPGYRLYFGQSGQRLVILLCGGDKSTQTKDIHLAKRFWEDYKRAN